MTQKQVLGKPEEIKRVIPLSGGRQLALTRPLIMGILNVTPDSFSDGGDYVEPAAATGRALEMVEQGADIIDIGGESTRPGAIPVGPDQELTRIVPVIKAIRDQSDCPISVDTYRESTARTALDAGADIINDISALRTDSRLAPLIAERNVPVVLMHMQGTPQNMQRDPSYRDCVEEIAAFFEERIDFCRRQGINKTKLVLDPGIGFGKRLSDNTRLLSELGSFRRYNLPLLIGVSRKSFIGMLNPISAQPKDRLGGSVAAAVVAVLNGADIVRVHDIRETVEALKVLQALTVRQ